MLREIINFTKNLTPENRQLSAELPDGLHISTHLAENKLLIKEFEIFKPGTEKSVFLRKCHQRVPYTVCVSPRKKLDSPFKLNMSSSPFCIAYDKESFLSKLLKTDIEQYFEKLYKNVIEYCDSNETQEYTTNFILNISLNFLNEVQQLDAFEKLRKNQSLYIYFDPPQLSDYEKCHSNYLSKKVFNRENFNLEIGEKVFGVSDYLSSFPDKKPYFQHRTATFEISNRLSGDDALYLFKFAQMQLNKILPNPLPVFIDKKELNDEVIKIFNREGEKKISYPEIIKEVYNRTKDLGNYYLLNFWGISVRDFDFVSSFQYQIEPTIYIKNLFNIPNMVQKRIDNIFDFEKLIVQKIFDNQLIQLSKEENYRYRYFDEIEYKPQYISATMFQLVLKYRKAIYDYIYKSKHQAITALMFHDIMKSGILENIKEDKYKEGKHTKNYQIKDKLNIWFSLYEFFDHQNYNGEQKMANKIVAVNQRLNEIATVDDKHIENDDEFAFAAGQVIYYLLSCSEAGNKTHALLEPFLQKSDLNEFKMAISRIFNQYKHAIRFYKGKFEKLMTEVLSYELDSHLKHLMPMILAGYFADSIIYQKTKV